MKRWLSIALLTLTATAFAFEERTMSVQHLQNSTHYFGVNIQNSSQLEGIWNGWCADWNKPINDNVPMTFKFYSSYSQNIPAGLIAKPENLDELNWLINKNFVGKDAGAGLGLYTSGDVQLAIWTLIDDNFNSSTVGPFSQARVDKIVAKAIKLGKDFFPKCKQKVVIILDPGTPQSVLIEIVREHFPKCSIPEDDQE